MKNGKTINYRDGGDINETYLKEFFEKKEYNVVSIEKYARHAILKLGKSSVFYCAKVSLSVGVNILTTQEILWNKKIRDVSSPDFVFNVQEIVEDGTIDDTFVYFITPWKDIGFLAKIPTNRELVQVSWSAALIQKIVSMTQQIQQLSIDLPVPDESLQTLAYQDIFIEKTRRWMQQIPQDIEDFEIVKKLFFEVRTNTHNLEQVTRQGDVAPWHMSVLPDQKIFLFDGEHAHSQGVEGYDIAYFIQRVYSVLLQKETAMSVFDEAVLSGYGKKKLKTVLASRAIGGFCDESLLSKQDYSVHLDFANWVLSL